MPHLTMLAIMLSSFAGGNARPVLEDHVDLIELNHHYDKHGLLVMDQVIFYHWCPVQSRYRVRDWRPLKSSTQVPSKDFRTGKYSTTWKDGRNYRRITAEQYRETWTAYDPELIDSMKAPKQYRKTLTKPRK